MVDTTYGLPRARSLSRRTIALDKEFVVAAVTLLVALATGLVTAGDYVLSVDEFNTDDYGPKALAWYASGFSDRSHFDTVEAPLWLYGPWFQMLVAFAQSLGVGDAITVRHALTFVLGLAGLAAVVPMGRLAVGRWAGVVALALCLLTGYVWGNLFFATIDVPFLFAMNYATLAILLMARGEAPRPSATVMAGLFMGLAVATRTGGVITHAYLAGAMGLWTLEIALRRGADAWPLVRRMAIHAVGAVALAWVVAVVLWPWLQLGNPFTQFAHAYGHFAAIPTSFEFRNWGIDTFTDDVPWWYIGGQMLVRLPEGFLALLAVALASGAAVGVMWGRTVLLGLRRHGIAGLRPPALMLAGARAPLLIAVAAFGPLLVLIVQDSTLYDGIRHVLFTIPMLALVAAWGAARLMPLLRRLPVIAGVATAAHATMLAATLVILHPLEYVAMNAVAGSIHGARGNFELDYWSIAVADALRKLEVRLDADPRFMRQPPRVMICIGWREQMAGPLLRRPWLLETEPAKADFLIATERFPCADGTNARLIDTVARFGVDFAWIYANNRGKQD